MLKTFKNQYWTRLIRVEDFCAGQQDKFELGPDVAEAVDEMYRLDADASPQWQPLFDPQAFQQEHPKPLLKDWVLGASDCKAKGELTAKLRAHIDEKAEQYLQDDEMPPSRHVVPQDDPQPGNQRNGLKYSTATHNPEGLREKEIRARYLQEKPAGKKYKHRRRCQLSSADVEEIVAACNEGSLTQPEVAKKYKVKAILVSQLVTEARKQPEKLRILRQKEKELERAS